MVRLRRRPAGLPVTLALVVTAVTVALAGCATAPSGGPPRSAPGAGNQVQAYVQQLPFPGPTSKWSAKEVVVGFLHASASYAFDRAAAQQFLAPSLRKTWHPGRAPVAVLSGAPTGITELPYRQILGPHAPAEETVDFTGQQVATLSQTGQYQYAPGQKVLYTFTLARTNDVWLIEHWSPAQQSLLLTQSDFDDVYLPRNLFFYAPPAGGQPPTVLVPDPVYAPEQSSNSALNKLATGLVNGLINGRGDWLSGATVSAFPRGTRLLKQVTITDKIAKVDLGGAAARTQGVTRSQMATQLLATLGDGEYSPPLATQVALYINNTLQSTLPYSSPVWNVASAPVLIVTGVGSVSQLPAVPKPGAKPQPKLSTAQIGQADVTAIASSPDQDHPQIAAAVQDGSGCAVMVRSGGQGNYQSYPLAGSASPCTSLSYDDNGNLWAVAGNGVWFIGPNRAPVAVDLSAMTGILQPGDQILALRMAPDAVRAALLVHTPAGNKLLLAVAQLRAEAAALGQPVSIGVGLPDSPLAISWYDEFHLAVLARGSIFEVPLSGGAGQQPGGAPSLLSTAPAGAYALTTDGSELVVGTSGGQGDQVWATSVSTLSWSQVADGTDPIYPG